jgi:Ca2+-transporting ATPase
MTVVAFYDATWHTKPAEMSSVFLAHNIALNTTADIEADGTFIGNPTECALLNFYEQSQARKMSGRTYKEERADHHTLQAFPFSSELKHMTTISKVDGKIISYVKGSPESVFAMTGLTATQKAEINRFITATQEEAKRVIAFAHKELASMGDFEEAEAHDKLESNMIFDGFVAIADPLRQDVITAVKSCQQAGIALKILTGDNILTAKAIAKELNIVSEKSLVLEARDVLAMSDEELTQKLPHIVVIARSTPKVKMRIVQLLKASGDVVAVTGDGINDAPAIKNADVGIAMGISGTEVSKEASDIVLLDDSFSTIVKAIEWGRNIFENFKRFITFQLTVNVASVIVVLVSILMGFKAPFTALDLLWINIIMDGPPALTLGLEPNYADLMNRKPVSRNQNILSRSMMTKIFITGIYMSIVFLVQHETNFMHVGAKQEATVLFTLFTLFQLFNAFNCRELHAESIFKHLFANKLMLVVVGCTFVLQILIIQFGGAFFGTVPLDLLTWGKIFGLSFTVIIWSEVLKLLYRLFSK